ncbi:hypothetical protein R5W24_004457 [Gemmata sp. JC717]|uniref:hypothetical protein n=1 Tax=Gemmata algarum TaxID=2975278 RepID=UPI0021BAC250|nr:hypothetical protein [Gemmata algarum]MDY3555315.1 hypothetical protein [Gemmata algarum]
MRRSEIRTEAANTKLLAFSPSYSPERARRLTEELRIEYRPAVPYVAPAHELGNPPAWLYVSKRLAFEWLPNEPLWCSPAVKLGDVIFYRLSPAVVHWIEVVGGQAYQAGYEQGQITRDQVDAYMEAMNTVYAFAAAHLDPAACVQAKATAPTLPIAPGPEVEASRGTSEPPGPSGGT